MTRSRTGLTNVMRLLDDALYVDESLDIMYVTRNYLSRHGAGPLPWEGKPTVEVEDSTNQRNDWQGSLRVAPICFQHLEDRLEHDFGYWRTGDRMYPKMFVTHMDKRWEDGNFIPTVTIDGEIEYMSFDAFVDKMDSMFDSSSFLSFGATRDTVQEPAPLALGA